MTIMSTSREDVGERLGSVTEKGPEYEKVPDTYSLDVIPTYMSTSETDTDELREWHRLRTGFVINSGWLTPQELEETNGRVVDFDKYDRPDYRTLNVIISDEEGIAAGARLTVPKNAKDFLSRDMLEKSPEMQAEFDQAMEAIDADKLLEEGRLWDVTRLIPNVRSIDREELTNGSWREGMMRIFGAGVPLTSEPGGESTKWVFTTTPPVMKMLMRNGVRPIQIIASENLENHVGNSEETLVCMLDVHEAFQSVLQQAEQPVRDQNGRIDRGVIGAQQIAKGFDMVIETM